MNDCQFNAVQEGADADEDTVPRREDVECVCKLMATIGYQLDGSDKKNYQTLMTGYFLRMERWSNNKELESRLRFMLKVCRQLLSCLAGCDCHCQLSRILSVVLGMPCAYRSALG